MLDALRARKERFVFEDIEVTLKPTVMAFITMNPGYPGRAELPESLKVTILTCQAYMTAHKPDAVALQLYLSTANSRIASTVSSHLLQMCGDNVPAAFSCRAIFCIMSLQVSHCLQQVHITCTHISLLTWLTQCAGSIQASVHVCSRHGFDC